MKKIFSVCALVASCFFFVACPDSSDSASQPTPEEKQETESETEKENENTNETEKETEKSTKKESDWLFLFYFDADNNLNDEIYANMRQAEYALSLLRNTDGTAKDGCPTVNMVALWDGESKKDAREYENRYVHPKAALYELGADYDLDYYVVDETFGTGFVYDKKLFAPEEFSFSLPTYFGQEFKVGANTTELSLSDAGIESEPNMGDVKTLTKFLTWANKQYAATNVVLCLSDHGAGTGKEQYTDTEKSSRTLCADDTGDSERMLSTKNIRDALNASGYTGDKKLSVLWMDVCLQASVEIAYDLRGSAFYLLASPNLSVSNEYSHALKHLTTATTPEEFGKMMVSEYYHFTYDEAMSDDSDLPKSSGCSMYTMSLIDLNETKLESLKSAIDDLADALLALSETDVDSFNAVYTTLLAQDTTDLSHCTGLAYVGTYAVLNDIGFFADGIVAHFSEYADLCSAAIAMQSALDTNHGGVIVSAYGGKRALSETSNGWLPEWDEITENQMYMTGNTDFLTGESVSTELSGSYYGLTIETQNAETEASLMTEIAQYIEYLTGKPSKATTFDELCAEFKQALIASGKYKPFEATLAVAELKKELGELDYVSHYADYTGFSEKWADVIVLWYSNF